MAASQTSARMLSSWKEIAAHLGVGMRTAQVWERERGLPVHRLPGPRGRVYTTVAELETWRGTSPAVPEPVVHRPYGWAAASVITVLVLLGAALSFGSRTPGVRLGSVVPLTTLPELEVHPHLSPNGERLAYVRAAEGAPVLIVQEVRSGETTVLGPVLLGTHPRWSPDGAELAYTIAAGDGVDVVVRSVPNGPVRMITHLRGRDRQTEMLNSLLLDWHRPEELFVADRDTPDGALRIVGVSVRDGEKRGLTTPSGAGDVQPSMTGEWLAFVRYSSLSEGDVWLRNLRTGEESRLTHDNAKIDGLAWLPDAQGLVVASNRGSHAVSLYHLTRNGNLSRLSSGDGIANFPSITGNMLVYQSKVRDTNIWMHDTTTHTVAPSTAVEHSPSMSPDGTRVAFISKRTGATEVWMTKNDETVQLTSLSQTFTDSPRWSPDGRLIAFTSQLEANRDIYLVDTATKVVRRFTTAKSEEGRPSFSRGGQFLYYRSNRTGRDELFKQPLNGTASAQVTHSGGFEGFESTDGATLFYLKHRQSHELWQLPTRGGTATLALKGIPESHWGVAQDGIYAHTPDGIMSWHPRTGKQTIILGPAPKPLEAGFSVSLDGKRFVWSQVDQHAADIMRATLQQISQTAPIR